MYNASGTIRKGIYCFGGLIQTITGAFWRTKKKGDSILANKSIESGFHRKFVRKHPTPRGQQFQSQHQILPIEFAKIDGNQFA